MCSNIKQKYLSCITYFRSQIQLIFGHPVLNIVMHAAGLKVRFGLVSLFNGISTLAGYLMPKLFS